MTNFGLSFCRRIASSSRVYSFPAKFHKTIKLDEILRMFILFV